MLGPEKKHLRNSGTGEACVEQRAGIVDREAPLGVNRNAFALAMEFPREWLARLRVTKFQASVVSAFKVCRLCRASPTSDVRWCSDRNNAAIEQLSRDQRGCFGFAESHGEVEAVHDEIAKIVSRDELDFEVGVRVHERVELLPENGPVEDGIQIDSQLSAHSRHTTGRGSGCFLQPGEVGHDLLVKTAALFRQGDGARRSVEEPDLQPLFQSRDRPTDARWRHAYHFGSSRKCACVDYGGKHANAAGQFLTTGSHGRAG